MIKRILILLPPVLFKALVAASLLLSISVNAKVYPRAELQNCWVKAIESGTLSFSAVDQQCQIEREAVVLAVPEPVRKITESTLDDALKRQIGILARHSRNR